MLRRPSFMPITRKPCSRVARKFSGEPVRIQVFEATDCSGYAAPMSEDDTPLIGPDDTAYRLELTPAQLKITYTALKSLLDDFGHDEPTSTACRSSTSCPTSSPGDRASAPRD